LNRKGHIPLGVQTSTPGGSALPHWGIPPVVWCRGPSASSLRLIVIACCPTHPPVFQPSATEPFRSPLPDCGTLCPRRTSRRRRNRLLSENVWRLFNRSFPYPL